MLKNVLSLLLSKFYSKKESELVGHQAMPSTQNVALTPTTTSIDGWGSVYQGIAPTDGFACIRFTADTATCIASAQTRNVNVFTTPQVVGDILLCTCPIAKGQVFTLCARGAKNIECWFTKTIGGGYQALKKLILQGGAICLNSLSSSLRRSSLLENKNGLQVGGISQSAEKYQQCSLTAWTFKHTRLQQTVSCLSDKTLRAMGTLKSMLVAHGLTLTKTKQRLTTKESVFRLLKEERSPSRPMEKTEEITLSWNFLHSLANLNPTVGGASC